MICLYPKTGISGSKTALPLAARLLYPKPSPVVLLLPPAENTVIETAFVATNIRHDYQVLKLWEQDPEVLMADPALLPLAPLAAAIDAEALLRTVANRVSSLEGIERQEVSSYTQILAGLKYSV